VGGYDASLGWTGDAADRLTNLSPPGPFCCDDEADVLTTAQGPWIPLDDHLRAVAAETKRITSTLALPGPLSAALVRAAELHDVGKSLPQWQEALPTPRPDAAAIYAKAPAFAKRPGMRHEAASALAAWQRYYLDANPDGFPALTIYLIAAHHGIVRTLLSSRRTARQPNVCGIPVTDPPPTLPWHDWPLDFACAKDGADGVFNPDGSFTPIAPGWTGLVADLLGGWEQDAPQAASGAVPATEQHSIGPFRLAFLEAVLRAADAIASAGTPPTPKQEPLP
jgi:CRISPR-associated endonuclease/helicase Cas3